MFSPLECDLDILKKTYLSVMKITSLPSNQFPIKIPREEKVEEAQFVANDDSMEISESHTELTVPLTYDENTEVQPFFGPICVLN